MISTNYIHEYAQHDQFVYESHYILCDIEDLNQKLNSIHTEIEEKTYFGESYDAEFMEAESGNIFTRIGEAIIALWNSFIEMCTKLKDDIKDSITGAKKKSSTQAYMNAMEEDPELAEKFLNGVMSGNIKASDIKDIDILVDQATKINNELATGKINKKTYGERIDSALEKFANTAKSITAIVGLAAIPATIYQARNNYYNQKQTLDRNKNAYKYDREGHLIKPFYDQAVNASLQHASPEDTAAFQQYQQQQQQQRAQNNNQKNKKNNQNGGQNGGNVVTNSAQDYFDGQLFTEAANFTSIINKLLAFVSGQTANLDKSVKKLEESKELALSRLQTLNPSDADTANTIMSGTRKVMSAVGKEYNTMKNLSAKINKAM